MMGHLQQSLGLKLQWEKADTPSTSPPTPAALPAPEVEVKALGGRAARRCLRHLTQVALRDCNFDIAEPRGYVLEILAEGHEEPLETSGVLTTRNPTWELACEVARFRQANRCELRAVAADASKDVLWRRSICLAALEPLHCEYLEQCPRLPPTAVPLLQLGKEWFFLPQVPAPARPGKEAPASRAQTGPVKTVLASDICNAGDHISAMVARLRDLKGRSAAVREAMDQPLRRSVEHAERRANHLRQKQRLGSAKRRVQQRKERLEALGQRLQLERGRRERQQENQAAAVAKQAGEGVDEADVAWSPWSVAAAGEAQVAQPSRASTLLTLRMQLKCQQLRMLHDVCQVYPIENQGRFWTIRGLSIPCIKNLTRQDLREEETVSTALGFLAHLMVTLAGLLEVPLRVSIRDAGSSRCFVRDLHEVGAAGLGVAPTEAAGTIRGSVAARAPMTTPREWPLYYGRGVEKGKFETALRLLQDGLHQFVFSQGQVIERGASSNLLEHAELILRKELFGVGQTMK